MANPRQQQQRQNRTTTGWLSFFLFLLVLATTALLMGLLTPSWQVVYLEDGRTEHHHGLWLDCKRDFSYDYGRPREYYETLHRRYDLAGPFDQFWLPALLCVFKFDYYLDDEDWFDHGYDENQLWGDSYQHLFLGWKIAVLAAHIVSALCALFAIISLFCAFCHRLCTCIAAVLVVIAVLAGWAGNILFYMFASDQDNNIIKEEDGIYEQHFGWSFWVSLIGNCFLLASAMFGCVATRAVLGSRGGGRQRKFIKIQLNEIGHDDSAQLLNQLSGTTGSTGTGTGSLTSTQMQQHQPFRRTKSTTVYNIDSQELRRWERETMRNIGKKQQQQQPMGFFTRTNSMPMIRRLADSSSIASEPPHEFIPSAARQHQQQQQQQRLRGLQMQPAAMGAVPPPSSGGGTPQQMADVIYEYVDRKSMAGGDTSAAESQLSCAGGDGQQLHGGTKRQTAAITILQRAAAANTNNNNHYDPVPLANSPAANAAVFSNSGGSARQQVQQQQPRRPKGQLIQPVASTLITATTATSFGAAVADTEYLQPKSLSSSSGEDGSGCSTLSSAHTRGGRRTPLIVPAVDMKKGIASPMASTAAGTSTFGVFTVDGECPPQIPLATFPVGKLPPKAGERIATAGLEVQHQHNSVRQTTPQRQQQQQFEHVAGIAPLHFRSAAHRLSPPLEPTTMTPTAQSGGSILSVPSRLIAPHDRAFEQQQQQAAEKESDNRSGANNDQSATTNLMPSSSSVLDRRQQEQRHRFPSTAPSSSSSTSAATTAQQHAFRHQLPCIAECSEVSSSKMSSSSTRASSSGTAPTFLGSTTPRRNPDASNGGTIKERLESILSSPRRVPSEMDRSIGSSRTYVGSAQSDSPPELSADGITLRNTLMATGREAEKNGERSFQGVVDARFPNMQFDRTWRMCEK